MNTPRLWVEGGFPRPLKTAFAKSVGMTPGCSAARFTTSGTSQTGCPRNGASGALAHEQRLQARCVQGTGQASEGLARDLHSQYPDAAASVLEGIGEMRALNELGINARSWPARW